MNTAQQLLEKAFHRPRTARSDEYKAGLLAALQYRLGEIEAMPCPHKIGTAQADAWFSGTNEGHYIYREHIVNKKEEA